MNRLLLSILLLLVASYFVFDDLETSFKFGRVELFRIEQQNIGEVFLMSQKPAFPRGLFNACEKMRFHTVNGL